MIFRNIILTGSQTFSSVKIISALTSLVTVKCYTIPTLGIGQAIIYLGSKTPQELSNSHLPVCRPNIGSE